MSDVAVDESRDLLYVSGAATDDRIVVAAADGSSVREIVGVTGATQLALNPDGTRLYAAVPGQDAVAEVDTGTLAVRLLPTGDQTCPREVAVVGDNLWYAEDDGCQAQHTELRELDLATGQTRDLLGGYPNGSYYMPAIRAVPATGKLLINDQNVTGGSLDVVDPTTETVLASTQLTENPGDLLISPDGSEVAIGHYDWPQRRLGVRRLSDLAQTGEIMLPEGWIGTEVAGDADLLVARSDDGQVGVFDRGTTALLNTIRFGGERQPGVAKVELVNGTLVAITVGGGSVRMFSEGSPAVPAPTLTASAGEPVVVGHPTTLSGTLTEAGTGVDGVHVTVRDELGTTLGETVTDATGAWSLVHTWDTVGAASLMVTAEGGPTRKAAVTTLDTYVDPVESTLEVSAPASVPPGTPIAAQGHLSADGAAVEGAVVQWWFDCSSDYRVPEANGSVTTAADGSFAATYDPGDCTNARLWFGWDGDATRSPASTTVHVAVDWHRSKLVVTAPSERWVQDDAEASVALTVDGDPAEGAAVQASVRAPDGTTTDLSGTTGPDGTLTVRFPTSEVGDYTIRASRAPTADTFGSDAAAVVAAKQVPTALTLSASPSPVVAGDPVVLTGSLTREDHRNEGAVVQVIAVDDDGSRRDHFVTTDADGGFSVVDTPATAGSTSYTARYDGDGLRYQAAQDARVSATVLKATPSLTLRTDQRSYRAGQTATLFVDIAGSRSRTVTVTAARSGGSPQALYEGTVPADGLTLSRRMQYTERFTVTTPADATHEAASKEIVRGVRLNVTTTAQSPVARTNGWAVYRTSSDPVFAARTSPARPGACLRFQVQRQTSAGWRTVQTSACRSLDDASRTRWRFTGTRRTQVGYRVRARFAGDDLNLASTAPWARFRFR